ncbi:Os03g0685800 [Oryza sativa Japonica Group]|uniref:Expressed protein n=3 Tax=Oryza sativa TaxID=4530 RepID=Q10F09_ORYSJ|nr:expressed protein [Oryza sativa Japonica Group]EEC75960.1 hypothetical protein OsI_13065 [Oryza sativa Indica Group]KAB8093053.1 hypothetical protein EE612_019734 [Oryza sativa]BAF12843.1 Os03g0685800 [Oryza sativa Japonica Group]BAG86644.1 unnamed protein product [Oryza sativa Japonica Group]|eukprot:NP_001050929.1 Os03g0685800 [Oryza sativa Japonica Group]
MRAACNCNTCLLLGRSNRRCWSWSRGCCFLSFARVNVGALLFGANCYNIKHTTCIRHFFGYGKKGYPDGGSLMRYLGEKLWFAVKLSLSMSGLLFYFLTATRTGRR